MGRVLREKREQARRLFLTGATETNAEIAARVGVKPHTVGAWRRREDWDGLRLKIDRRAAEMLVEKIATDRVALNLRHFRYWELLLAQLAEDLKNKQTPDARDLERIAGILHKAQQGQRLAKGMSTAGETEEAIRAQAQAEIRRLIDAFTDAVKEHIEDEQTRERIRHTVLQALPEEEDAGPDDGRDKVVH